MIRGCGSTPRPAYPDESLRRATLTSTDDHPASRTLHRWTVHASLRSNRRASSGAEKDGASGSDKSGSKLTS
jgi:hypothetical protein